MTPWIFVLKCVHFNWDIQGKMAFVETTIDSNTEKSGLTSEILLSQRGILNIWAPNDTTQDVPAPTRSLWSPHWGQHTSFLLCLVNKEDGFIHHTQSYNIYSPEHDLYSCPVSPSTGVSSLNQSQPGQSHLFATTALPRVDAYLVLRYGALCFGAMGGNPSVRRAHLNYTQIFDCTVGRCL